ncbi:alkyl sulfatase dimerization domain-containing protein [Streptomyces sp. NPDC047315]|uniref:alkyl/aryl-sulfatase n=1 Tax=Streptomyces sp. NPDC047315 TaxID=3155142 RepID=UPI0033FC1912
MSTLPQLDGLDWDDPADHANATRGLVDRLDSCVIRNASGRVVWDGDRWSFLEEDCPDTANPSLWRQSRLNALHGLFEVVPGIYQVRGLDASNMTLVEGERGVVVIDPLISKECAAEALALYRRNRGDRPVTAVVYTHSHSDHFGGVLGVTTVEAVAAGETPVIAPSGFMEHTVSENVFAGPAMARRASFMYGNGLPAAPDGMIGCGLGQATSTGSIGVIPPTVTVEETGQQMTFDGVRLVFQLTPETEAPSEMNFFFPDHKVLLVAENANHTLHNVLTLRGALVRDARAWASYLTETVQLFADDAEVLIGSHNWPTWGRTELTRLLSEQRDAYAYLHDQTVRLMNRGLTGTEIAEELSEFPGQLGRAWHVRGYYGTLSHNIKAIYQRYMGWYDGNPARLHQLPPTEAGRRYVEFMGGPDALVAKARASFEAGEHRWVAEVLDHVVFAHPEHTAARELQARTFERLGYAAESAPWRNFYLSGARELRDWVPDAPPARAVGGNPAMLAGLSSEQIFHFMAIRLDGPRAAAHRLVLRWEFTDRGESWTTLIANGVLTPMRGDAPGGEEPQLTLRLTRPDLERVLSRRADITGGSIELNGDVGALTTLQDLLEDPPLTFPIVTP